MKRLIVVILILFFSHLRGADQEMLFWAKGQCRHYPELLWLARDDVIVTEEGEMDPSEGWSKALYGKKYMEFDRTLLGLYTLKLINEGSDKAYQELVEHQSIRPLSFTEYLALSKTLQEVLNGHSSLNSQEVYATLQTGLILQDSGKTRYALSLFEKKGIHAADQNHFYAQAIDYLSKEPSLSPSFQKLPDAAKKLLWQTREIAHYGHITHLEGGLEMFSKAKSYWENDGDMYGLKFDFILHVCEVAGALGHIEPYSSIVLTDDVIRTLEAVRLSCSVLSEQNKSEKDAYLDYAKTRLQWVGIDYDDPELDLAKAKIITSLRIYEKEDAHQIERALLSLPEEKLNYIIKHLCSLEASPYPTPTYVPALLINYVNTLSKNGLSRNQALRDCVTHALPKVLELIERYRSKSSYGKPLCFNTLAGLIKRDTNLFEKSFDIDWNMEVVLK